MHEEPLPDELRRALKALDAEATRRADAIEPARVAHGVLARLRSAPSGDAAAAMPRRWSARVVRLAAAVVLLVAGAAVTRSVLVTRDVVGAGAGATLPLGAAADTLDEAQAGRMLEALDAVEQADGREEPVPVTIEDLTETELRALLEAMQSSSESDL